MTKKTKKMLMIGAIIIILANLIPTIATKLSMTSQKRKFNMISSTSNMFFEDELKLFAKENNIDLSIDYYGDLEIVDILNSTNEQKKYDAVWISNSIWLYMLDNSYLVTDSKSIGINPVVLAVTKDKANELNLYSQEITNENILRAIETKKLNYVMPSVTKTNIGATAYLGFLNSLAGSPEVLTVEMLKNPDLIASMKAFFKGVERVSGDELYLEEMLLVFFIVRIFYCRIFVDFSKKQFIIWKSKGGY